MLKNTSLASVVAFAELLYSVQLIYAVNYKQIPLLMVAVLLVPGDDQRALRRPVLHRAPLRPRLHPRAAGDDARALAGLAGHGARGAMSEPMVKAEGVHKRFGRLEVLKGIDLEVKRGEVMCLLGPSGSGKSTFLRCINHLEKINSGRLSVDGELVGYREAGGKLTSCART